MAQKTNPYHPLWFSNFLLLTGFENQFPLARHAGDGGFQTGAGVTVFCLRPEFAIASATGAAKCFEGFENFQNVLWLGAGELLG